MIGDLFSGLLWWILSFLSFLIVLEVIRTRLNRRKQPIRSYQGYRVLITGASAGIGKEMALQYAAKGCRLILAARRVNLLEEVRAECLQRGSPDVLLVPTDMTQLDGCRQLIEAADGHWGGEIDLLVLNAGRSMLVDYSKMPVGSIKEVIELNLYGCFYPTHFALPLLKRAGGSILAISSLAGIAWSPLRTIYCASKHALLGFFNSLRVENPDITISLAYPGWVVSEIHDKAVHEEGKVLKRNLRRFMPTDVCVRKIIHGVHLGQRDIFPEPLRARMARWVGAILPEVLDFVTAREGRAGVLEEPAN